MSPPSHPHNKSIAIIGGGIAGLAAAHALQRDAPAASITLYDANPSAGGVLQTENRDGFLIERSADSFLHNAEQPWAQQLAEETGYGSSLIETNPQHRRALVWWDGRLHPVPAGFQLMGTARPGQLWSSRLLTWRGKMRLASERFVPRRRDGKEESLAEFATRRVGREAYQRLVQPLVAGIYTADPTRLSVAAALPRFVEMEQQAGSVTAGLKRRSPQVVQGDPGKISPVDDNQAAGARYAMFLTPREGMGHFVGYLQQRLTPRVTFKLSTTVVRVTRTETDQWQVESTSNEAPPHFDAVILALPFWQSAALVADQDDTLARELHGVRYSGAVVISVGFRRDQIGHSLDAFGVVVPAAQQRNILAVSFSSVKFPGRARTGSALFRVFVGGACREDLLETNDDQLRRLVLDELSSLLEVHGEPVVCSISRWNRSTPQYEIGHRDRLRRIEQQLQNWPTLALAGNGFYGVGIPHCIHSGQQAAARIRTRLFTRLSG